MVGYKSELECSEEEPHWSFYLELEPHKNAAALQTNWNTDLVSTVEYLKDFFRNWIHSFFRLYTVKQNRDNALCCMRIIMIRQYARIGQNHDFKLCSIPVAQKHDCARAIMRYAACA
jgi:hypothetical protein